MTSNKEFAQAILRKDFLSFFEKSLPVIMPGADYKPNWHIRAMAAAIQEMIDGETLRYVINIQPRMGKSLFSSVALPMFIAMRDPAAQIMCLSYADQLASQFHTLSRLLAKAYWYRGLNPDLKFKSAVGTASVLKETGSLLQTTQLGYRMAVSFFGSITGQGADWIILDDPNDMSQINSEAHRNKIKETFDQTIATRLNSKKGRILLVTQRGHVDDLAGHLLAKGGFKHLMIEAIASQNTIYHLDHGQKYFRKKGELIDPRRFGSEQIEERRTDLGSVAFEAQYQQNPLPHEGNIFKRKWFNVIEQTPEFQHVVITGDIAGSLGRGDYSAFLVWGYRDPVWYLIAAHRAQLDLPGVVELYRKLDVEYLPDVAGIEENGLGRSFIQRMQEIGYLHVSGASVTGDKVQRAEGITPLLERGEVAVLKSMPLYEAFMAELLSFPSSKNDDMVDAFSFALNFRQGLLAVANTYRRDHRKHLPRANTNTVDVTVTTYGSSSVRDRYFERMGRSVFSR